MSNLAFAYFSLFLALGLELLPTMYAAKT